MKVIVSGATGFIGKAVLPLLVSQGWDVTAIGRRRPAMESVDFVHVDLLTEADFEPMFHQIGASHFIHLAWNATPGVFWTSPDNLSWAASSLRLMEAFSRAGGRRIIMSGSCAEYDWDAGPVLDERLTPAKPATFYGIAKDGLRRLALSAAPILDLSVAWGRIFWLYGPGEPPGRLTSDLVTSLKRGDFFETTEGLQRRDFLHVSDVAGALVAALRSPYQGVFNISSGKGVRVRDLVGKIAERLHGAELVKYGAKSGNTGDPVELVGSNQILVTEIGYVPMIDLDRGIADLAR